QVARRAAARMGLFDMLREGLECSEPALRQLTDRGFGDTRRRPRPGDAEFGTAGPVELDRIDLDRMCARQRRSAAAKRNSLGRARKLRGAVRRREASRKASQIVEADLRHRKLRQLTGGLRVEVA